MENLPTTGRTTTMTAEERRATIIAKAKARTEAGEAPQRHGGGSQYLSLDGNTGALTIGRAKTPVPPGQEWVVLIDVCKHGFRYWEGGNSKKEMMVNVLDAGRPYPAEGEVMAGDLPKPRERDGWSETVSIALSGIGDDSELKGILGTLDCSNRSSISTADELMADCIDQIDTADGQRGLFNPIIEIEVDSYHNKNYSRDVYFPVFKIKAWTDGEEILKVDADDGAANILD